MAAASSGALDSGPAVNMELSVCRGLYAPGRPAHLLSSGQECPCCPGPSRPLPVPGGGWILGCVPGALCSGASAVALALHPCSHLSAEPPPEPL